MNDDDDTFWDLRASDDANPELPARPSRAETLFVNAEEAVPIVFPVIAYLMYEDVAKLFRAVRRSQGSRGSARLPNLKAMIREQIAS